MRFSAALAGAALLACLAASAAPRDEARERELRELRGRIEKLQGEVAAAERSSGEVADQLRESGRAVSAAHRALFDLAERRAVLEADLASIAERERGARAGAVQQEALAEKLLRLQHRQRAPDRLRLALEGRDAATVARHLEYYGYVQRARAELIGALRSKADQLAALEAEARARRDELAANEVERQGEAQHLEMERAARAAVATRIADDIVRGRREIGRLQRDEARLSRLVEELARALAATPPAASAAARPRGTPVDRVADASSAATAFASLKGRLAWPVRGELMNRFGAPREESGGAWKGLFIRSPTGETVRAIADGLVVYADWLRGFGNLLIVDHGKGYMSLYGHNDGLVRQVGDKVRSGDPIAHVGQTGALPDSGLYFELRREGKPFDPMSWIAQ